jgi:SAM-dependent methyltransferase
MTKPQILDQVRQYYEGKLAEFGPTARGVDWNSEESQNLRFRQLARLLEGDAAAGVIDYGCGYGAMARYLRDHGHTGDYIGYDVSDAMIAAAQEQAPDDGCRFVSRRDRLSAADYTVASGIFNVRQQTPAADWRDYMLSTIGDLAALGRRGFAFNALTLYSDPERRRDDLYYADPLELFDYCKRHVSRFVSLLHDTPLYEFTLLVRF